MAGLTKETTSRILSRFKKDTWLLRVPANISLFKISLACSSWLPTPSPSFTPRTLTLLPLCRFLIRSSTEIFSHLVIYIIVFPLHSFRMKTQGVKVFCHLLHVQKEEFIRETI